MFEDCWPIGRPSIIWFPNAPRFLGQKFSEYIMLHQMSSWNDWDKYINIWQSKMRHVKNLGERVWKESSLELSPSTFLAENWIILARRHLWKWKRLPAALSSHSRPAQRWLFDWSFRTGNPTQMFRDLAEAFAAAHVAPSSIVLWDVPVDGSCFFELEWLLANPTRWKGALGHGHSSSRQLTSHAILYPIIGVKYQEPVRHVTCKLMGGGSWQPVCLKRSISACLKPSLRAASVLQMQSAWLKSLQSWEDVSLIPPYTLGF